MQNPSDLLDHIEIGVIVQDTTSQIIYANSAATHLLALDQAELLTRNSLDPRWQVILPDGTPLKGQDHPVPEAIRTGAPVRGRVIGVWRPRTEDRVWLMVNALPQLNAHGEVAEVICTFTNISQEQLAQQELKALNASLAQVVEARTSALSSTIQALRESESHYRAVISAMAEGVVIHERDGKIAHANPAAQHILGISLGQLQGSHPIDPFWELTHANGDPLGAAEIPSEITRETGTPCRAKMLRVKRGQGDTALLSVNTAPIIFDQEPPPHRVVATFTDITSEREALASAEHSRDRLRQLTEAVPGLILECFVPADQDKDLFTFASTHAKALLGVDHHTLLNDAYTFWRCVHPDDLPQLLAARTRAIEERAPFEQELRIINYHGELRWVRLRAGVPQPTHGGHLIRCIMLDVTNERRIAKALYDSQRQEAVGTLAAGIAHNFNNMLAAILPSIELALTEAPAHLKPSLEDAQQAALAAADLVKRLLGIAGHSRDIKPEPLDFGQLVSEVVRVCHRTFDRRVELSYEDLIPANYGVRANRSDLQQLVLNLIINARDATQQRASPTIKLRTLADDSHLWLYVEDNGTGIPDEVSNRIGEPFFTTKPVGQGTGLGLASAIASVRELGGDLTWSSDINKGTIFLVKLPAIVLPTSSLEQQTSDICTLDAPSNPVLLVDDEQLVRRTVKRHLERQGMIVVEATSGQEALDLVEYGLTPALVLLDLSMPGISGAETLTRLKQHSPSLKVFIMSGYIPNEDTLDQADGVLHKPMTLKALNALLNDVLE